MKRGEALPAFVIVLWIVFIDGFFIILETKLLFGTLMQNQCHKDNYQLLHIFFLCVSDVVILQQKKDEICDQHPKLNLHLKYSSIFAP